MAIYQCWGQQRNKQASKSNFCYTKALYPRFFPILRSAAVYGLRVAVDESHLSQAKAELHGDSRLHRPVRVFGTIRISDGALFTSPMLNSDF